MLFLYNKNNNRIVWRYLINTTLHCQFHYLWYNIYMLFLIDIYTQYDIRFSYN